MYWWMIYVRYISQSASFSCHRKVPKGKKPLSRFVRVSYMLTHRCREPHQVQGSISGSVPLGFCLLLFRHLFCYYARQHCPKRQPRDAWLSTTAATTMASTPPPERQPRRLRLARAHPLRNRPDHMYQSAHLYRRSHGCHRPNRRCAVPRGEAR